MRPSIARARADLQSVRLLRERKGGCYFELLPGACRLDHKHDVVGSIAEGLWEEWIDPLLAARCVDYDKCGETEVPRAKWLEVLDEIARLKKVLQDCESPAEVRVFARLSDTGSTFRFNKTFAEEKAVHLRFLIDMEQWLEDTIRTHEVVTIIGL